MPIEDVLLIIPSLQKWTNDRKRHALIVGPPLFPQAVVCTGSFPLYKIIESPVSTGMTATQEEETWSLHEGETPTTQHGYYTKPPTRIVFNFLQCHHIEETLSVYVLCVGRSVGYTVQDCCFGKETPPQLVIICLLVNNSIINIRLFLVARRT